MLRGDGAGGSQRVLPGQEALLGSAGRRPRVAAGGSPLTHPIAEHPILTQLFTAACVAAPMRALSRRSATLRSESVEVRRLDQAALQFTLLLILDLLVALLGLSASALSRV